MNLEKQKQIKRSIRGAIKALKRGKFVTFDEATQKMKKCDLFSKK